MYLPFMSNSRAITNFVSQSKLYIVTEMQNRILVFKGSLV